MKNRFEIKILLIGMLLMMLSLSTYAEESTAASATVAVTQQPVDADAAIKVARSESCLRCHGVSKKKEGPPYTKIAAFYRNNADAEDALYEHITTGPKVKLTDGHKEKHKAVLDKSPEQIRNLVRWILAQ